MRPTTTVHDPVEAPKGLFESVQKIDPTKGEHTVTQGKTQEPASGGTTRKEY